MTTKKESISLYKKALIAWLISLALMLFFLIRQFGSKGFFNGTILTIGIWSALLFIVIDVLKPYSEGLFAELDFQTGKYLVFQLFCDVLISAGLMGVGFIGGIRMMFGVILFSTGRAMGRARFREYAAKRKENPLHSQTASKK
ncbi:MAG: hypothetical protein Q4B70_09855 [Lachnospiraceae bacterium]|nr:hypothetical protein [Lachnospiraceae bacterium]